MTKTLAWAWMGLLAVTCALLVAVVVIGPDHRGAASAMRVRLIDSPDPDEQMRALVVNAEESDFTDGDRACAFARQMFPDEELLSVTVQTPTSGHNWACVSDK